MNLTQTAGASSTHSKRCRAFSTFQRLAKRLECVRLAGAFGSWSRCAVVKPWRLPTNHRVAEGILPAVEGRHPAVRTCCHPFLRVDCFDAFSAGLEAPALRQAGCLPLRFRGSTRENRFRGILTPALSPSAGERENRKTDSVFCRPPHGLLRKGRTNDGAVLLEVILALVLFAAAAVVIGAGMHSAIEGVTRQKLNLHAVNLAVSVLSEIQMGFRSVESLGPETFESPFDHWTWQLILTPTETDAAETSDLTRVEIIVRHDDPAVVHRLTQILKLEKKTEVPITATPVAQP